MEASNAACMSKRRRILGSPEAFLVSPSQSDLSDSCLLLNLSQNAASVSHLENSVGSVAEVESCSSVYKERLPVSCCSSNDCGEAADDALKCRDLETKSFETVDSARVNGTLRDSTPTSELCGDSDEMDSAATKSSKKTKKSTDKPMKTPPLPEIEDFFAEAEKFEQKRFIEKYNFDVVMDVPLEGRYQWIRLKP